MSGGDTGWGAEIDQRAREHGADLLVALHLLLETADLDVEAWHEWYDENDVEHEIDGCARCEAQRLVNVILDAPPGTGLWRFTPPTERELHDSCCVEPVVRGGMCVSCGVWVADLDPTAPTTNLPQGDNEG